MARIAVSLVKNFKSLADIEDHDNWGLPFARTSAFESPVSSRTASRSRSSSREGLLREARAGYKSKLCSNTVSIPLPCTVTFLRLLRFIMYKYDYRRPYPYKVYTTSTGNSISLIQVVIETEIARISSKTVVL